MARLQAFQGAQGRREQYNALLPQIAAGDRDAITRGVAVDSVKTGQILELYAKADSRKQAEAMRNWEATAHLLEAVLSAPAGRQQARMYEVALEKAQAFGLPIDKAPKVWNEETAAWAKETVATTRALLGKIAELPGDYRRAPGGGLEFTPGGGADPAQVRRLAEAKAKGGGGLTVAQQRENAEIQQARAALDREGLSHEDVMRISKSQRDTGRDNPEYSPFINSRVRRATRRKLR